jgi:hypothetical protein
MVRLVGACCPNCGGQVKIDPTRDYVTCTYCGANAFIERADRRGTRPPGEVAVIVLPRDTGSKAGVVVGAAALLLLVGVGSLIAWLRATGGPPAPPAPPPVPWVPGGPRPAPEGGPRYWINGSRRPLYADIDGDRITDFVLSFSVQSGGGSRYAYGAFRGQTGKLAWQTSDLGTAIHQCSAALAAGRLLVASPTGELTAYALADGARQWTTTLGDQAMRFCREGDRGLRVLLSDDRALGLDLGTGRQSPTDAKAACEDTQRDDELRTAPSPRGFRDESFGPEQVTWSCANTQVSGSYNFFVPDPCPRQLGSSSSAFGELQARGIVRTGPGWAVLGTRAAGTPSPMVGYVAGGRLQWSTALHPTNPLAANQGKPDGVVGRRYVVATYALVSDRSRRAAGFALDSGKRLWDVPVPLSSIDKMAGDDDAVAITDGRQVVVLSTRDGGTRFSLGK